MMKNRLKNVDDIFEKMIDSSQKLSLFLPQIASIALECTDYEGFCILNFWGNHFPENKEEKKSNLLR